MNAVHLALCMRKLPPLAELRAFEAAARSLSFRLAAAELGVTPTAVSHQIRLLEAYCGQPLFRRQPRPVALTWAGQQLFPVVRDGLESLADAINGVRVGAAGGRLRVTTTNAFAARWLVPRLPKWREAHPRRKLDIVGTDAVLNLETGEADISIRYVRRAPTEGPSVELVRDTFLVVANPKLVGRSRKPLNPVELGQFPLIEAGWPASDKDAPTWRQWETAARKHHKHVPESFRSGQPGLSRRASRHRSRYFRTGDCDLQRRAGRSRTCEGGPCEGSERHGARLRFLYRAPSNHPKLASIKAFIAWALAAR